MQMYCDNIQVNYLVDKVHLSIKAPNYNMQLGSPLVRLIRQK